ncbi:FAD-binding oxidoreductase [Marinimicrococcus flavescens]|uniref:FAD-binding oxidoreductase n=1 Tax=Marinimicrococcus flavescens TaxID=3031815 RepID=A0AAP4D5V1_9PROT|nr:FAD-binding oxidoreductase [Marinimicrococcus flavescens]
MTDVVTALTQALGKEIVCAGDDVPARNRRDWTAPEVLPLALVRPRTTEQVATAMRLCHEHGTPVVPQGGLTGLCGGGRPVEGGIALSLERMTGVEEIDPATASMTVRSGTPLEAVQKAADEAGFLCPLDLGARGSCAIGGNLSTNAGGNRVIRYGMTREMVLGLEVVLPDGTVVNSLNKMLKNNAGYDLKQLFIGSEGTLGVITRAVLRLWPKPRTVSAAFCGLADFDAVLRLLDEARGGLGATLSAFEVMWPSFYDLITAHATGVRTPLAGRHGLYVLLEAQGSDAAFDDPRFEAFLERMMEEGVIEDAAVAQSQGDIKAFWALRDAVAEWDQILGGHVGYDIGLPTQLMDEYALACEQAMEARFPGATTVCFGHVGDGNLHVVAHAPGHEVQPYDEISKIVYGLVRERGGTVSAEHGIGTLKKPYFAYARTPEEIALMVTLKRAIDPKNILNPGKILSL